MADISSMVSAHIQSNREQCFEHIVPIDLTTIFTGYGPLPAVTGTRNQVGGWDEAGQTRTVELSDGSTAGERMDSYRHPEYFSYTVSGFSGALRFLATSANGEWWFQSESPETTSIRWHYRFNPRSIPAVPILWFINRFLWRGYMTRALSLAKQQLES